MVVKLIDVTKQGVNVIVSPNDIDILIGWCKTHKINHATKDSLLGKGDGFLWFEPCGKIDSLTFGRLAGYQNATVDEIINNNNIKKLLTS